jgi:hypothetical protein
MSLIDSMAVVRPAACFLQRGVNFQPVLVPSVREGRERCFGTLWA